jgi:hypothetical protein
VLWDWGTTAQAALTGVFGVYLLLAAALNVRVLLAGSPDERRTPAEVVPIVVMGAIVTLFAVMGLLAAGAGPF